MPTNTSHLGVAYRDLTARDEGSLALCEESLYSSMAPAALDLGPEALSQTAWVASGSACSDSARRLEERVADVLSEATHLGAIGSVWGFLLGGPSALDSMEVEFQELLPPQPRRNHRVVAGVIHRSTARWAGLALSEEELGAVYVEDGDG